MRPVRVVRCQRCHNGKPGTAGLNLTTAAGFHKGADMGLIVVPGDIANSRILQVISYQERIKILLMES